MSDHRNILFVGKLIVSKLGQLMEQPLLSI